MSAKLHKYSFTVNWIDATKSDNIYDRLRSRYVNPKAVSKPQYVYAYNEADARKKMRSIWGMKRVPDGVEFVKCA